MIIGSWEFNFFIGICGNWSKKYFCLCLIFFDWFLIFFNILVNWLEWCLEIVIIILILFKGIFNFFVWVKNLLGIWFVRYGFIAVEIFVIVFLIVVWVVLIVWLLILFVFFLLIIFFKYLVVLINNLIVFFRCL